MTLSTNIVENTTRVYNSIDDEIVYNNNGISSIKESS